MGLQARCYEAIRLGLCLALLCLALGGCSRYHEAAWPDSPRQEGTFGQVDELEVGQTARITKVSGEKIGGEIGEISDTEIIVLEQGTDIDQRISIPRAEIKQVEVYLAPGKNEGGYQILAGIVIALGWVAIQMSRMGLQ